MRSFVLSLLLLLAPSVRPQDSSARIEISPANPSSNDVVTFRLSGTWPNGCVPQSPKVSVLGESIVVATSNPAQVCTLVLTPWELTGSLGELSPGVYTLVVTYSGAGGAPPVTIGRESFAVAPSSLFNELVLPVVVNGSIADRMHYQTIFTVLNTTTQSIRATLQVYGNDGTPRGVFCSPLAPPPSGSTFTLDPDAQYFQFTSADLPFVDGWARLTWYGPSSLLAGEELTLVEAEPLPCRLVCNRPSTEKLSSAQVAASRPARSFRLPATMNRFRQTGLAIVNPSETDSIRVRVSILDAQGARAELGVPGSFEVKLGPRERISKLLWAMALEHSAPAVVLPPPDNFQGSLVLASDAHFALGALHIMLPEGKFASVPAVPSLH